MLRRAASTLLALLKVRLELAGIELQEEADRVVAVLACAIAGVLLLGFGCVFLVLAVTVALWDTHRLAALAVGTVLFIAAGAALLLSAGHDARKRPPVFPASVEQLSADRRSVEGAP
jgi:uncharacterized membrane protein YqjE